jgi:hypothetical protein
MARSATMQQQLFRRIYCISDLSLLATINADIQEVHTVAPAPKYVLYVRLKFFTVQNVHHSKFTVTKVIVPPVFYLYILHNM